MMARVQWAAAWTLRHWSMTRSHDMTTAHAHRSSRGVPTQSPETIARKPPQTMARAASPVAWTRSLTITIHRPISLQHARREFWDVWIHWRQITTRQQTPLQLASSQAAPTRLIAASTQLPTLMMGLAHPRSSAVPTLPRPTSMQSSRSTTALALIRGALIQRPQTTIRKRRSTFHLSALRLEGVRCSLSSGVWTHRPAITTPAQVATIKAAAST